MSDIFKAFLFKYLGNHPDALLWVLSYVAYCHCIDDIIDKDNDNPEFILKTFRLAITIFSYHFYQQHIHTLKPLTEMAHDCYRDSVVMEQKPHPKVWEKRVGDVIRQNANDVILAVIAIVSGIDARNEASMLLRELSYKTHHDDNEMPT